MVCEEALLRDNFNTLHKWIHDTLAEISKHKRFRRIDVVKKEPLLNEAQMAAKKYIDDVGQALKNTILQSGGIDLFDGSEIFDELIKLLDFFGDSFGWRLRQCIADLQTELIQAIQLPLSPNVDYAKVTKVDVENYAKSKGYNLKLPDNCFETIQDTSPILLLRQCLSMSECTLEENQKYGKTVLGKRKLPHEWIEPADAFKRNRQVAQDDQQMEIVQISNSAK